MILQRVLPRRRWRFPRIYVSFTRLVQGDEILREPRPHLIGRRQLDIIIREADFGGHFLIDEWAPRYHFWRALWYRPGRYTCGVTKVLLGQRVVLSISFDW